MAILNNYLKPIADAIREKKGTTEPINAQDFATEISNLPSPKEMKDLAVLMTEKTFTTSTNIEFPSFITKLGDYSFYKATANIIKGESITEVGASCFDTATISNLNLPNLEIVRDNAFNKYVNKLNINTSKINTLGSYSFAGCKIDSFDFSNINVIPTNCLRGGSDVRNAFNMKVSNIENIVEIQSAGFYYRGIYTDTKNENGVYYMNFSNLKTLGDNGFRLDGSGDVLSHKQFPVVLRFPKLQTMGQYALGGAVKVEEVYFDELEYIPNYAFYYAKALKKVYCPKVKSFGQLPFNSSGITEFKLPPLAQTLDYGLFKYCTNLTKVDLSDCPNLTDLGGGFVEGCTKLTLLEIPERISNIGNYSLNCGSTSNKATFIFKGTTPPTITTNTFKTSQLNKIIVPKGASATYKSATNWSAVANYIFEPNTITFNVASGLLNNENVTYSIDNGDEQQFTQTSIVKENLSTLKVTSKSANVVVLVGTTQGGSEIGTVANATTVFTFTSDTTIYITLQQ